MKAEANARAAKLESENLELKARVDQQEKDLAAQKRELAAIKKKLGL